MVGPFMQGVLLMGIIYWYSKGLINMINDYYRSEFNRKLKSEIAEQKLGILKAPVYDLDDMDQLLNIEMNNEFATANHEENILDFKSKQLDLSFSSANNCLRLNSKVEFFNILFTIIYKFYKVHPFQYPMCWVFEDTNGTFLKGSHEFIRIF